MAAPICQALLIPVKLRQLPVRWFSLSTALEKNIRSGCYKITNNRSKGLTYEEANPPYHIGVRKGWNSINTSNLFEEDAKSAKTTIDDLFVRKFINGTWHRLFLSEIIIKRRHNMIIIAGLVNRTIPPRKMYFLLGYTEQFLSNFLKQPVKMEIQTVQHKKDMMFKWI